MASTWTTIVAVERRTYSSGSLLRNSAALAQREALRHVTVKRIVGAGLVGDDVDLHAAANDFRQDIGAVANKADGEGAAIAAGGLAKPAALHRDFLSSVSQ